MDDLEDSIETWKPIPGWKGIYEASSLGRVRRVKINLLKMQMWGKYRKVYLSNGPTRRQVSTHIVIAESFLGPKPYPDAVVNHKNGKKLDNRPDNLEWTTPKGNVQHAIRTGLKPDQTGDNHWFRKHPELVPKGKRNGKYTKPESTLRGESHPMAKLTNEIVLSVRAHFTNGWRQKDIARLFGLDKGTVYRIVRLKSWRHIVANGPIEDPSNLTSL